MQAVGGGTVVVLVHPGGDVVILQQLAIPLGLGDTLAVDNGKVAAQFFVVNIANVMGHCQTLCFGGLALGPPVRSRLILWLEERGFQGRKSSGATKKCFD